jgi:two-component system copper resistance phosphate regulon response regulator CusR
MTHALIIDDEVKVAQAFQESFESEGYGVCVEHTGAGGLARLCNELFDVALLDLTLPDIGGLRVLEDVRARGIRTPVLVLTARDALVDRVAGLNGGADDYVVKPFAVAEVSARVRALLRRGQHTETPAIRVSVDDMHVDRLARRVTRAGQPITLTIREYELLDYLVRHCNEVVSREMLARDVWMENGRTTSLDNVIDVHIARLRRKLDPPAARTLIATVRGVGFTVRGDAK